MIFPKKFYRFILLFTLIGLQFIPKFGLDIGLKPDDVVFSLLFILNFPLLKSLPKLILISVLLLLFFTVVNVLSYINNQEMSSILFPVRYLFYGLAFLLGYKLQSSMSFHLKFKLKNVLILFIIFQFFIVLAQKFSLIPGIYDNIIGDVSKRPTGLSSHPTELGFINLLLLTVLYQLCSIRKRGIFFYGMSILILTSIFLSDSRTGLISGVLMIMIYELLERNGSLNLRVIKIIGIITVLPFILYFLSSNERLKGLGNYKNVSFVSSSLQFPKITNFEDINPLDAPMGVDQSLYVRVTKWSTLLYNARSHFWLGTGPGSYGVAIDGLFLRVFGESGLLGFIFYSTFLGVIFFKTQSRYFKVLFLLIMGSSLFIDTLFFSRFAYLFYLYSGLNVLKGSEMLESHTDRPQTSPRRGYDTPLRSEVQQSPN